MSCLQDFPKEILYKIIEIIALEKENDLIRKIVTLDKHYKKKNNILSTVWNPCSSRHKPRKVYIYENSLVSRIFPMSKLPQEKKRILFLIQIMNTQARYIIEKKLFKLEVGLIRCMYNVILHTYGFNESDFKKVANIVTPDFIDRRRIYELEEWNKQQDEKEIYEQYQKEKISMQKEKDKMETREIWRNIHRQKKDINFRYRRNKLLRAYSKWVNLIRN